MKKFRKTDLRTLRDNIKQYNISEIHGNIHHQQELVMDREAWPLVMNREAWHAAAHEVRKSRTRLSD